MVNYSISQQAEKDLDELARFIARDNIDVAFRLYDMAKGTYEQICQNPMIGKRFFSKEEQLKGIRYLPMIAFSNYLVFHKMVGDEILIIRVLHMSRQISKIIKIA